MTTNKIKRKEVLKNYKKKEIEKYENIFTNTVRDFNEFGKLNYSGMMIFKKYSNLNDFVSFLLSIGTGKTRGDKLVRIYLKYINNELETF